MERVTRSGFYSSGGRREPAASDLVRTASNSRSGAARSREVAELAGRGREHPAGDPLPAPQPLRPCRAGASRPRRRSASSSASQALSRSAIDSTARSSSSNETRPASSGGSAAASSRLTSAARSGRAETGSTPAAAASAATIPNASGNVLGKTSASVAGTELRDLAVLEPAGELDAAGRRPTRRRRSRRAAASRKARSIRSAPCLPALQRPAALGELTDRPEVARSRAPPRRRVRALSSAPNPTISSRAPGCARWTSGHAASSRSTPFETISLPTNTTRGPGASANQRTARRPRSTASRRSHGCRRLPARSPVTRGSCVGEGRRKLEEPGASLVGRDRERTARCRRRAGRGGPWRWSSRSSTAWRSRSAMCEEPTRIPAAPSQASRA